MKTTINAVFKTSEQAMIALEHLSHTDVTEDQVSVLASDNHHGKDLQLKVKSKAAEGIATGGVVGGILGAIGAGLVGAGTLALTGGTGVLVAGPLAAALAGAGAGAGSGGLIGGLIGMGIDKNVAKQVEHDIENGSILISVQATNDQKDEVQKILDLAQTRDEKRAEAQAS